MRLRIVVKPGETAMMYSDRVLDLLRAALDWVEQRMIDMGTGT